MFSFFMLSSLITFFASIPLLNAHPYTSDTASSLRTIDIDDSDLFDDSFFADIDLFSDDMLAKSPLTPDAILNTLNLLNAPALVQQNFFLHTNPFNKRSLLDKALFEKKYYVSDDWSVGMSFFYTYMHRSRFTKHSTDISSYVALEDDSLLAELEKTQTFIQKFNPEFIFDSAELFSLFAAMTVQERNAGCMFNIMHNWGSHRFQLYAPLYYVERNFYATEDEKKAIEAVFGVMDPASQETFQKEHLISDKLGLGDTRLMYDAPVFDSDSTTICLGVQATIPTAFKWTHGLKGSLFGHPDTLPLLDTALFFSYLDNDSLENQQAIFDEITGLSYNVLDRLSAALLDTPLGNNHHVGIGIYEESFFEIGSWINRDWAQPLSWRSKISLEYLTPADEYRFFITKVNPALFALYDFNDVDTDAQQKVDFLTMQALERYSLRAFQVRVQPGIIFWWRSQLQYNNNSWHAHIGSDFWVQTQEHLGTILTDRITQDTLDKKKAVAPTAYQGTIFGGMVYTKDTSWYTWSTGINLQGTTNASGIGHEYGAALSLGVDF